MIIRPESSSFDLSVCPEVVFENLKHSFEIEGPFS